MAQDNLVHVLPIEDGLRSKILDQVTNAILSLHDSDDLSRCFIEERDNRPRIWVRHSRQRKTYEHGEIQEVRSGITTESPYTLLSCRPPPVQFNTEWKNRDCIVCKSHSPCVKVTKRFVMTHLTRFSQTRSLTHSNCNSFLSGWLIIFPSRWNLRFFRSNNPV